MNILDLRYEAGELKKKVIAEHASLLDNANSMINAINIVGANLASSIDGLKELIKLAEANINYYQHVAEEAKEQLKTFESLVDGISQIEIPENAYPVYYGKCIECGMDLDSNMSFTEEEPGNYICLDCHHKITSQQLY